MRLEGNPRKQPPLPRAPVQEAAEGAHPSKDPHSSGPRLPHPHPSPRPAAQRAPGEPRPPGCSGLQAGARSRPAQGAVPRGARPAGAQARSHLAGRLPAWGRCPLGEGGKLRKSGRPRCRAGMLRAPPRPQPARTRGSGSRSLGAHGPSRARPPAWRRSVAPSPARSEHGAPTLKSRSDGRRGARGPVAPGGQGSERGPQAGGRERRVQRTGLPRAPRASETSPPSEPLGHQEQKSYLWAAGRPGAPRRGDPAGTGVLLGGAQETPRGRKPQLWAPPPPFAGDTEAPRSCGGAHAQTPSEEGQPRPDFPPARGGGGATAVLLDT